MSVARMHGVGKHFFNSSVLRGAVAKDSDPRSIQAIITSLKKTFGDDITTSQTKQIIAKLLEKRKGVKKTHQKYQTEQFKLLFLELVQSELFVECFSVKLYTSPDRQG
jgi:hypothetical protein